MRELVVYYETRAVGVIEVHDEGPHFVYASGWLGTRGAFPISVTMPLSEQHVPPEVFLPWAANLLPEGAQLRAAGLTLGAAPEDVIGILSEIGRDTAGALSIGQPGSTDPGDWRPIGSPENLERIISELPPRPPDDAEGRKLSRQGWMGRKRAPRHRPLSQRADPICGAVDSGPALAPHPHSRRPVMARWACAARSAASYGAGLTSISNTIRLSNRFQSVRRSAQLPFLG